MCRYIENDSISNREDKKKRRIEKEIKKLEKLGKKLKPIDELEPNHAVLKEAKYDSDKCGCQTFIPIKNELLLYGSKHKKKNNTEANKR